MTERDKLDELLARGRLSAPQRERIFEEVYRLAKGSSRWRSKYMLVAGPLALAAALFIFLRPQGDRPGGYATKGTSQTNFALGCSGGDISHCPRGSKLIFRLDALPTAGFLHAYAEPVAANRERIWYYPTTANPAPRVEPALGGQTMDRGIVVGTEHGTGRYRVHVVIASTPLSHEDLLGSEARNVFATDIVEMEIVDP